ncbi:hypothetical protein [Brevundimonas subvibrioides]|uniref:Lipoprotein n=1 Tax=Brevundimonas subvibrioides (strain ATCC 15264 / DSM 4735 / LMG 14903 / NBRC 16000 / CB 81) TaxID=633149 RepID=D9QN05_BRESC|nr:hypothetical protein [Brevundimonas subvibrioides]ADL02161.1 hypothetical protein Bresu_2854 [Brevundimonas subvibrioides ATCC 15264]
MSAHPYTPAARLAALAMIALTSACASVDRPALGDAAAGTNAAAAGPAPIAGYDWHLSTADGAARLAYGVAESDDLKLGFDCDAGSGRIEVTANAPTGTRTLLLESGGETERLDADGEPSQLTDGDLLTAAVEADIPIFQRFRRIGWMAQWIGDRRETYAAHPESQGNVERFFALCD